MSGHGMTSETTRPQSRLRRSADRIATTTNEMTRRHPRLPRSATRIAGTGLALLLTAGVTAVPAQAATGVNAGVTWSQTMRRKLALDPEAARLTALLPGLRTAVTTRNADLARAVQAKTAATTTLTTATVADQAARIQYATARTAAVTAKKAVTAAPKIRPRSNARIAKAKQALTAANATVKARAVTVARTAAAFKDAETGFITATNRVTAATTAYENSIQTVTGTQQRIAALPPLTASLAAQATSVSKQVVTETRSSFTITQTTQVYGVTVNKIIAYPFQRMIDDAAKAGIQLSGGGFRTRQQQIALRTINGCPDVWTAPSSSCKVPTAIPGRSLHELGLAIDMTSGRKTITDRKSAAFKWLTANAGTYGLVNLPSEPWHWSITGS
jgi:zinc D-Ala-D-Ala carboxypeptidase